jgi:hypothetical protein
MKRNVVLDVRAVRLGDNPTFVPDPADFELISQTGLGNFDKPGHLPYSLAGYPPNRHTFGLT